MMTSPNIETITASLERSLEDFSLNSHNRRSSSEGEGEGEEVVVQDGKAIGSSSDSDATLDLNSNISLPYHWEQCLYLKTGEIYYINWRNGMKAKEDPRRIAGEQREEYYYSDEEERREESSSESSPLSFKVRTNNNNNNNDDDNNDNDNEVAEKEENVLVVAGCKSCFMYLMVPKQAQHCPKCTGQLLHFDGSDNASSSP